MVGNEVLPRLIFLVREIEAKNPAIEACYKLDLGVNRAGLKSCLALCWVILEFLQYVDFLPFRERISY